VNYVVTIATLNDPITEIALYQGGVGQVGSKVLRLTPSPIGIYQLQASAPCSSTLCRDISRNPSGYFVLVSTQHYPGGALRGQLHSSTSSRSARPGPAPIPPGEGKPAQGPFRGLSVSTGRPFVHYHSSASAHPLFGCLSRPRAGAVTTRPGELMRKLRIAIV